MFSCRNKYKSQQPQTCKAVPCVTKATDNFHSPALPSLMFCLICALTRSLLLPKAQFWMPNRRGRVKDQGKTMYRPVKSAYFKWKWLSGNSTQWTSPYTLLVLMRSHDHVQLPGSLGRQVFFTGHKVTLRKTRVLLIRKKEWFGEVISSVCPKCGKYKKTGFRKY